MELVPQKYWHKIATNISDISFSSTGLAEIEIGGRTICIAKFDNQLYACAHKCPHAGGALAKGFVDIRGNIVCPEHHYKFSLQNGRNISGEGYFLKTFPIAQRTDGYYIQLNEVFEGNS